MTINWIFPDESWAFKFICEHYSRAMTVFGHVFNGEKSDVNYICSPSHFKKVKPDSTVILHVDSNRWYERVL